MANKTSSLATFETEQSNDKIEAQFILKEMYPEIIYDSITDSYEYRGYKFDYFKSGIGFPSGSPNGYLLVDKENSQLWLFSYGEKEDRWQDYLKNKEYKRPKEEKYPKPFIFRILDKIAKLFSKV